MLLVYQIILDLFILTFHPTVLLNSRMNSNRLAIAFLGVSIHTIVLSANIDNVISSLPIFILPLLIFCVCVVFFFFFYYTGKGLQ